MKMKCPYCLKETKVIDKRETKDFSTRRRRQCKKCGSRFTTYEKIENKIFVRKKDGRREMFSIDKLTKGIEKACEKRPISQDTIKKIASEIENKLSMEKSQEIKSSFIGNLLMKKLAKLDKIAYIRFASVYKEFKDIDEFKKELKKFNHQNGKKISGKSIKKL